MDRISKKQKNENTIVSQIKFDREFLEKLLSKLTVGNGGSIHLNAVPGKNTKTKLDLTDLGVVTYDEKGLFESESKMEQVPELALKFFDTLLTRGKFSFPISWDNEKQSRLSEEVKQKLVLVSKKLDSIVADNEDMFLETGIKNFGFGYPLLVKTDKKDPKKIIVAPVFIWSLDIVKSNRKNEWIISKTEDSPIKINELLVSHIENDEKITLESLGTDDLEDGVLSEQEILDNLNNIFKKLNINERFSKLQLERCISKDNIEKITGSNAWIQWSGVFGLYRSQKEPIIEATRELLGEIEKLNKKTLEIEPFQTSTTSSFETDPSQSEIINTLNNDEFKIIQGPPGTGKSQAISAIISNALANGAKTLVVCEKKTALDVLANNLKKQHLDQFCIVVDDVVKDRASVVKKARSLESCLEEPSSFDEKVFEQKYKAFIDLRNEINAAYKGSSKPIFAQKNWTEIVGCFLKHSKNECFNKLKNSQLSKLKYKFIPEELEEYVNKIRMGEAIYGQIKNIPENTFGLLNFDEFGESISIKERLGIQNRIEKAQKVVNDALVYFNKSDYTAGKFSVSTKTNVLDKEIEIIDSAVSVYRSIEQQYKQSLSVEELQTLLMAVKDFYSKCSALAIQVPENIIVTEAPKKISELNDIIELVDELSKYNECGQELLGDKFDSKQVGFISGLFSKKYSEANKLLHSAKSTFVEVMKKINVFATKNAQDWVLGTWDEFQTVSHALEQAKSVEKYVKKHKKELYDEVYDMYQKVSDCVTILISYKKSCSQIADCKKIIESANLDLEKEFPLIATKYPIFEGLDAAKERLVDIDKCLDNLLEALPSLDIFNRWIKLRTTDKKLFDSMTISNDWENDFKGVYYYNLLLEVDAKATTPLLRDDVKLRLLRQLYKELQKLHLEKIHQYWENERYDAIQSIDEEYGFKALFALKKNQKFGKRLSLRQIIEKDFDAFTTIFPVLMVNPIVANALLPLKLGIFDLVIFDEASQLRIEDVYTSMLRGKYKIIAGDKHQMPPSNYFAAGIDAILSQDEDDEEGQGQKIRDAGMLNAESLLEFTDYLKFKNMSYLDFHYRSKHPALIQFSNAAFYGNNLCPLPVTGNEYIPIILKEVNGTYKKESLGKTGSINKEEALEVVRMLAELPENENGTLPSVGIATFNIFQRNCIKELLFEAAHNDPVFADKFAKLQESGLFVKNLENIQGDERDIIIISTTFGPDETGHFYERFGPIGKDNGYKLINVLITRAKEKVFVITSIPHSQYRKYKELRMSGQENNKKSILYAYLSYAKAISSGNIEEANGILKDLCQFSYDTPRIGQSNLSNVSAGLLESVFEEEVYNEIVKILPEDSITPQYKIGGYRLDFMIEYKGHKIALECDGKAYHSTDVAYIEDMQRQKWIEQFGFIFHRIWSTNWFENKDREIVRFKQFLSSLK